MRWIVTDDIFSETWRQLLEFANLDLAKDSIVRRHGAPRNSSERANYAKQAKQARVCVLQAKEYFDAARASSLFTSPNHSYYGAVALASLTLLILGDGRMSLDLLRQDNRNNHHGLDFKTGCTAKTAAVGLTLLEQSSAEVLRYGHFANWYDVLPKSVNVYAKVTAAGPAHSSISLRGVGGTRTWPIQTLQGRKLRLVDELRFLPDLCSDLQRFGVETLRCKSKHEVVVEIGGRVTHSWRLYETRSANELEHVMSKFAIESRYMDMLSFSGELGAQVGIAKVAVEAGSSPVFKWPDCRDTLNHDTISYAEEVGTHEAADLYLVAYQLSMLSRYFPDIWIGCMESQCRAAKLIERSVEIIVKKLPILVLGLLQGEDTIISTHREPWKD